MLKKLGDLTLREIAQLPNDDITCTKECPFVMANCREICAKMGDCLVDKIKKMNDYLDVRVEVNINNEQKDNQSSSSAN